MSLRVVLVFSLVVLALAACGSSAAPTAGEVKDFAAVCDKSNSGKRIAVEGYLRFPDSFTDSKSVVLRLYEKDDFSGSPIGVQIDFGTGANQIETVKDKFSDEDLKVHLTSGQVSSFGSRVKVSGKVYYPLVEQEFACALENPLVESAP